jgi:dihydroorotase
VVDADATWTVDPARFRSKGRNTPYSGQTLRGRVALTVVDGRVIHRGES